MTTRPDRGFALDIGFTTETRKSRRNEIGPPASRRHAGGPFYTSPLLLRPSIPKRVLAEEIEIAAAVGLQYFAAVEAGVAALGHRYRRGLAACQLVRWNQQIDAALVDGKADA